MKTNEPAQGAVSASDDPANGTASTQARLDVDSRRAQLLAFGRHHFASHAFDALPVSAIAEQAGVSKALLYHYFGGRRGFYVATVENVIDEVIEVITPTPDDGDEILPRMLGRFVAYGRDNAGIYLALVSGGLGADPEVGAQLERVRTFAADLITEIAQLDRNAQLQQFALRGWVAMVEACIADWLYAAQGSGDPRDESLPVDESQLTQLLGALLASVLQQSTIIIEGGKTRIPTPPTTETSS